MMQDKARGDLEYIREVIRESRTVLIENGSSLILWGAIACIGTVLSNLFARMGLITAIWVVWGAAVCAGAVLFYFIMRGKYRRQGVGSFIGRVYGMAWGGCLTSMAVIIAAWWITRGFDLGALLGIVAALIGTAYFITGSITRYRAVTVLSFAWWAGGAALFFMPMQYCSWAMGAMAFAFELAPGVVMYVRNAKKTPHAGL